MNFFYRYKTIILIVSLIAFTVIMGFLLYKLFFSGVVAPSPETGVDPLTGSGQTGFPDAQTGDPSSGMGQDQEKPVTTSLPESKASPVANGGLTEVKEITSNEVLSPSLSTNGRDLRFYNQEDGKFYRIDKNGDAELMTDKIFHSVEKVTWANLQDKAVIEYPDGANIVYDFNTDKQVTLPKQWEDFDFSPQNDKLVWKNLPSDKENKWLGISNADGSGMIPVEYMGNNEDTVYSDWSPNNQVIAMYTKGLDFNRQEVFFVGLNDENFKSTIIPGRGFDPKWSPEGNKLLYSVYSTDNDMKPGLWVVSAQGDQIGNNRKNLKVDTWASKCAYSGSQEIYCSVPDNLPEGAGIFPELAETTKDRLYKINTQTGAKKLVAIPDDTYNMTNLIVDQSNRYLYFTDKQSNKLHQIKLK